VAPITRVRVRPDQHITCPETTRRGAFRMGWGGIRGSPAGTPLGPQPEPELHVFPTLSLKQNRDGW
jgi:hypothetical protein